MYLKKERIMEFVFLITALASVAAVILICIFLFMNGIPAIMKIGPLNFLLGKDWRPSDIPPSYGILPMIMGSLYVTLGALVIGVPIGLLTSVYMVFYCPDSFYKIIKPAIDLLAGVPSIVYGFFGMLTIVPAIRSLFGYRGTSILAASILLGIMILPTIIKLTETSLRAVPSLYYEGAVALGASHTRSVFFVVVPAAKSGILAAVVLGIGRAIGETMAVIMVAGNQARMPKSLLKGVRTLTANIVIEMGYAADLHRDALIATGVVLFVFILIINLTFSSIRKKSLSQKASKGLFGFFDFHPISGTISFFTKRIPTFVMDIFLKALTWFSGILTFSILLFLISFILVKGIPHLKPSLFALKYTSENVSLFPSIVSTLMIAIISLAVAVPLGICSAIYLTEYAKRDNKVVGYIRTTTETLSGIPSIVYGLFGYLFFSVFCGLKLSILSGALTLAIMILPLVMRSTEEALKAVPDSFREGSFGLGAGKLRTIFKLILPSSMPGILAGVILSIGRILGESAALIYTAGTYTDIPATPLESGRTLAVHMWALSNEGLHTNEAYATAVVLLVIVVVLNMASSLVAKRMVKG